MPVSLFAIIIVTKHVFGWTAAITSSGPTRPVNFDAGTYVTSEND